MKTIIGIAYLTLFTLAVAQKLLSQAEVFLRWNGEVDVTGPSLTKEFSRTDTSTAVVEFITSSGFGGITIIRDKGWESSESRVDISRYSELTKLLQDQGIVFEVKSANSRALPSKEHPSKNETEPNNAMEPTPIAVTIPAAQEVAPSTSVAHLGR